MDSPITQKPSQFERVVQALIYSFIIGALVVIVEKVALFSGRHTFVVGVWDKASEIVTSGIIAIGLGLILVFYSTNDAFFRIAHGLRLTSRTAFPSEWYGAFAARPVRYVVLHLKGDRRLYGYPEEWPTEPTKGHFRLRDAAWITKEQSYVFLDGDEWILIPVDQVEMVEFLK